MPPDPVYPGTAPCCVSLLKRPHLTWAVTDFCTRRLPGLDRWVLGSPLGASQEWGPHLLGVPRTEQSRALGGVS